MKIQSHLLFLFIFLLFSIFSNSKTFGQPTQAPLRMVVAGISHGHSDWIFVRKGKTDIELVGVYEPNQELVQRYMNSYNLKKELFFTDLNKMLENVKPEAAVAFGSVYDHMAVVEACAPRGIHVMVEKPLATNIGHANKMMELAKKHKIHILTNYETSWYPSTQKTYTMVKEDKLIGKIKKAVFHHGHEGPKEIGVGKEFLDWLTDPVQNGGGALIDFGCYGANIMTYLMEGESPISVTAVTRQFKPEVYSKVDDEATIIVSYPNAQCIIQASWNWPYSRKDMEVYGDSGYIISVDDTHMRAKIGKNTKEEILEVTEKDVNVYTDPFSYFADVVKGRIIVPINGLYSLENNLLVVKILDAAIESAKTGKTIILKK
ncbi:MAG: Gfo/Idh/MocA family oxidoreductase [Bacteroidota bacterium]|nr:Gfo/Idh/MocA family oxidoreductase [Bacteroidota bacterium]